MTTGEAAATEAAAVFDRDAVKEWKYREKLLRDVGVWILTTKQNQNTYIRKDSI